MQVVDVKNEFKSIIQNQYKKFLTHACISVGCKESAKDIVQETMIVAYQKLSDFQGKSTLETWIFGILNNKIAEYFRKKQKENNHIDFNAEEVLFHKNGKWKKEWVVDYMEEKEEVQQKNQILQFLKKCFTTLNEQYQKVFAMKFFSEKSTQEICKACNISSDNVWQVLHRGKLQLKLCIQSQLKKSK